MKKEFFDLENFDCNIDSFVMSSLIMQPPMLHQLENLEHNFYQTLGENSFFFIISEAYMLFQCICQQ